MLLIFIHLLLRLVQSVVSLIYYAINVIVKLNIRLCVIKKPIHTFDFEKDHNAMCHRFAVAIVTVLIVKQAVAYVMA